MSEFLSEFFHEYTHIVTDPAHIAAEVTFILVLDLLVLGVIYPLLKKAAMRVATNSVAEVVEQRVMAEHAVIDAEHGIPAH